MDSELDSSRRASLLRAMSSVEDRDSVDPLFMSSEREPMMASPMSARESPIRRPSSHYDAAATMHRLRSSMTGMPQMHTDSTADETSSETSTASAPGNLDIGTTKPGSQSQKSFRQILIQGLGQLPAIALVAIFHLMIGIAFGVSYFPMSWSPYVEEASDDAGPFPLPGKEALGIRMFLFSTVIGQIVFTSSSQFPNPIGLQMVENVPFCHELANIVIQHQGYGLDAISTLLVMFGLSSIVVGIVFYVLGKRNLGRVVYFFPTHVLIGCIGGIGVFLAKTGFEVTMADTFSITNVLEHGSVLWIIFAFEIVLKTMERTLRDEDGNPLYALLSPIYFCMITPIFYVGLMIAGISISQAKQLGLFFPSLDDESSSSDVAESASVWLDEHVWDMWTVIDIPKVSLAAIWDSLPTLLALSLFSLIHVPINIPAFALSTNTEVDMNNELIAHGYSNMIVGFLGGLQNYMAYTQSVLYHKSGGTGKTSGFAVAACTAVLFFAGPDIASYIPRCMAGTLLLHVGIDLFLEGVWDSYGKFDLLEYSGILLIVVVMTTYGMEAAMMAGVVAAVSTYVVQTVAYLSPVRGSMSAITLRSSQVNRSPKAYSILNSSVEGRSRILVIQLQGHLFFGNMANFTDRMHALVKPNDTPTELPPIVIIVDCSLVVGIDSSAAQAISKLKDTLLRSHEIELFIFVTGSEKGFPTEFPLTDRLSSKTTRKPRIEEDDGFNEMTSLLQHRRGDLKAASKFHGSHVSHNLDEALSYAEDALISRADSSLLDEEAADLREFVGRFLTGSTEWHGENERNLVTIYLRKICPIAIPDEDAEILFNLLEREEYKEGDYLWRQHSESDCAKLLMSGLLTAELENEAGTTECIFPGNFIGELGLVNQDARMSSVQCKSEVAIAYSLSRGAFEELVANNPRVGRYIDLICIQYLAFRVQHVSNRIFETRCLPI